MDVVTRDNIKVEPLSSPSSPAAEGNDFADYSSSSSNSISSSSRSKKSSPQSVDVIDDSDNERDYCNCSRLQQLLTVETDVERGIFPAELVSLIWLFIWSYSSLFLNS